MPNGFGFEDGWGFGFRVNSPPWPIVGVGRGTCPDAGIFAVEPQGYPGRQALAAPLSLVRRSDFRLLVEMASLYSGGIPLIEGVPGWRFPRLLDRVKERGNVD